MKSSTKFNIKFRSALLAILFILFSACFITACQNVGPEEEAQDSYEIILSRSQLSLVQYDEYVLTATIMKNGETLHESVSWDSSDDNVVSVSNGTVIAKNEGSAVVSAVYDQCIAKCNVTVEKYYDAEFRLSLSHSQANLLVTDTDSEEVTLIPSATLNGIEQTGFSISYECENQSVATISDGGVVTAVAAGTTSIKATATFGKYIAYCYCTIKVEVPKTAVLDDGEYVYEIATGGEFAGIPFSYGAVTDVISNSGATITYSVEDGKVYIDYPNECPKGMETVCIESDTHVLYAEVYIADRFISDYKEFELAVSEMADDKLFVLDADIDMSGYGWSNTGYKSLFTFAGEFDGNGHKLYGIKNTDRTKFTRTFSFAPGSHVHDLYIEVADLVLYQLADVADYVFGVIGAGAVVENCVFDLNLDVYCWTSAMFEQIIGKLRNCMVIYRAENPNTMTTSWLSGEVSDMVYIYSNILTKFIIGSSNGANYTSLNGSINNLYFYNTLEDAYNGTNGRYFYGHNVVRYEGKEYSVSDWWANRVDVTGDGVNDDTWSYDTSEDTSITANQALTDSTISLDEAGNVTIKDK